MAPDGEHILYHFPVNLYERSLTVRQAWMDVDMARSPSYSNDTICGTKILSDILWNYAMLIPIKYHIQSDTIFDIIDSRGWKNCVWS